MSDRNRQAKINLDYNILHNTGQKVVKVIKDGKMDVTEKQGKCKSVKISQRVLYCIV